MILPRSVLVAMSIAFLGMFSAPLLASEAQAAFENGLRQLEANEVDAAVDSLEEAVDLDDSRSEYYLRLGEAYSRQINDAGMLKAMRLAKKIRVSFEKAVELDPENLSARDGLIGYYLNAPKIAGGNAEKAMLHAEEIAKRDAQRGRIAVARVHLAREEESQAVQLLNEAKTADPSDFNPPLILGIHYTSNGKYAEAIDVYKSFLAEQPDSMQISYQLGRTASISGDYLDEGEAAFKRYLQHEPESNEIGLDWANYRLGLIYQHKQNTAAAKMAFEAALAHNPDHDEAKKALKKIN